MHQVIDDAQIHYRLPYEDPVVTYIDNGLFVIIRRKFRRFLTVNATNVNSRNVLKSSAAIREETHRHLQTAYYMIHPFSSGRVMWENVMAITFFSLFVLLPFKTALENTPPIVNVSVCIFDIICCCDICLSFNSGYSDKNTAKIIVNRNKVTRHYLKGYFFIDFLSSVPNALVTVFFYQFSTSRLILYFAYLKLIRIFTFLQYLDNIRDRQGYSVFNSKAIKFAIVFAIVLLWTTSFRHLLRTKLEKEQNTFIILGLLRSCLATMHNLSLIGYGFEPIYDVRVLAYVLMTLAIGVVLHLLLYAQAVQMLHSNLNVSNQYQHIMQQLKEYVRYKHIPEYVKQRILLFFEYKFEKSYYKENEILDSISENLKQDIFLSICQNLVEKVDFFQELPLSLLIRIIKSLKSETYLSGDVIVKAGVTGENMYFISSGTTAVYTINGKEICHLSDGNHFGEFALILNNEKRTASVVAIECCDLYMLNRKDFQKAIDPYPDLNYNIRKLAEKRIQNAMAESTDII